MKLQDKLINLLRNGVEARTEEPGSSPRYLPGDIVKTKCDAFGVITDSGVIVNGMNYRWSDPLPDNQDSHWVPRYSLEKIPGLRHPGKSSWWTADEFELVFPGQLHSWVNRDE